MRYLVGFGLVLALVASPLSVSAQEGEEGPATQPTGTEPVQETQPSQSWLERMHSGAFEGSAEKRDSGFDIKYTPAGPVQAAEARVHRAKVGVGVSSFFLAAGIGTIVGTVVANDGSLDTLGGLAAGTTAGALMSLGGLIGVAVSSSNLSAANEELRTLQEARRGKRHRVRFDPHTSRFVF